MPNIIQRTAAQFAYCTVPTPTAYQLSTSIIPYQRPVSVHLTRNIILNIFHKDSPEKNYVP